MFKRFLEDFCNKRIFPTMGIVGGPKRRLF